MKQVIDSFTGDYDFLSNFYPANVFYEGVVYPTVEHAYQASKTHSYEQRMRIWLCQYPGQAKIKGRSLNIRTDWEVVKVPIMKFLVKQKFLSNPELIRKLLATGDAILIEGNHHRDTFWGMCNGVGQNYLGKILMELRDEFACYFV